MWFFSSGCHQTSLPPQKKSSEFTITVIHDTQYARITYPGRELIICKLFGTIEFKHGGGGVNRNVRMQRLISACAYCCFFSPDMWWMTAEQAQRGRLHLLCDPWEQKTIKHHFCMYILTCCDWLSSVCRSKPLWPRTFLFSILSNWHTTI